MHQDDKNSSSDYDEVPYSSDPYCESTPENCYTIARLFKLNPPDFHKATVLELGCASGGNLIPLAYSYPDATFVGIDLSAVQIETGQKQVDEMALTNIQLRRLSILDTDQSLGKFDYIICHGVFSWVDSAAQEKVISLCNDLLSSNGIAYVSYNTLPGWNTLRSIRDMMHFHTKNIDDPKTRVHQARAILEFVLEGLKGNTSSYAEFLREEAGKLAEVKDSYLLHEYLEVENNPVYFHQFIDIVERHNLQYLADTSLSTMYTGILPGKTAEKLRELNNLTQIEQYTDFICNRRFRRTLLCRKEQVIHRNIEATDISDFYLSTTMQTIGKVTENQINNRTKMNLKSGDISYSISDPFTKQALIILQQRNRNPLHFDDLCQLLQQETKLDLAVVRRNLFNKVQLTHLLFAGAINIHSTMVNLTTKVAVLPTVSRLARYQSKNGSQVTNLRHQSVKLQPQEQLVLEHTDGSRSIDDLTLLLVEKVNSGELKFSPKDKNINELGSVQQQCELYVKGLLQSFAANGLLLAEK
jgi:methyltransferase-like protein/2-polyprenyl-3-methyl-5-hydroxy-6-metoxy-1,4-benzoquinol methylase